MVVFEGRIWANALKRSFAVEKETRNILEDLKPCPFCGGEPVLLYKEDEFDIGCNVNGCYLNFGADWFFKTELEAIEMWNKRPQTP